MIRLAIGILLACLATIRPKLPPAKSSEQALGRLVGELLLFALSLYLMLSGLRKIRKVGKPPNQKGKT